MSNKYKLFGTIAPAQTLLPESLKVTGGIFEGEGGLLIDGTLKDSTIRSSDQSMIIISATAKLVNCTVDGHDVVIEGNFDGNLVARGDCEITSSATVIGTLKLGGDLYKARAADVTDLSVSSFKQEEQQDQGSGYGYQQANA